MHDAFEREAIQDAVAASFAVEQQADGSLAVVGGLRVDFEDADLRSLKGHDLLVQQGGELRLLLHYALLRPAGFAAPPQPRWHAGDLLLQARDAYRHVYRDVEEGRGQVWRDHLGGLIFEGASRARDGFWTISVSGGREEPGQNAPDLLPMQALAAFLATIHSVGGLSAWERSFADSMTLYLADRRTPSAKQWLAIRRIGERISDARAAELFWDDLLDRERQDRAW